MTSPPTTPDAPDPPAPSLPPKSCRWVSDQTPPDPGDSSKMYPKPLLPPFAFAPYRLPALSRMTGLGALPSVPPAKV
jgi:hypothetical protein